MELDYKIIGKRIKEYRKKNKMTQAELAEKVEVEPSTISHIERATTKLSLPTLICIANVLGTSLDELVYTNLAKSSHVSVEIIENLLADCTPDEISTIAEVIKTTKSVLRKK